MRVTLCVEALAPNPGGIGRYTWQLCQGLAQRADLNVNYYGRRRLIDDPAALLRGDRLPHQRFRRIRSWWDRNIVKDGLFHGTNYFLPPAVEGIITVHDLSVFKYPGTHPSERIRAFDQEFRHSLTRARHVITDTETVRSELIGDFNISPEMVTAVHLGVEDRFRHQIADTDLATLASLGLQSKNYGLCVSTLEPRKRVAELLASWRRLPTKIRDRCPLALAGGKGWLNGSLKEDIDQGITEGWLRHLGFVQDEMLPALYRGARLFIYPSIYEGFGLPPLEAMACGTPVIVSGRSCMPEVCGEAVRYVNPEDPDDFFATIMESLSNETWQTEATARGLLQASKYSWNRCIEETVSVYCSVAQSTVSTS